MFEVNNSTQGTDAVRSVGNILEEGNGEDVSSSSMTKVCVAHNQEKRVLQIYGQQGEHVPARSCQYTVRALSREYARVTQKLCRDEQGGGFKALCLSVL